jgi:putative NADH-flavin reductase
MNITIIGGHGKVALLLEPLLVQAGHAVTAVIRNPDHRAEVESVGATAVLEDIQSLDAAGWQHLLADADLVVWSAGAGGGNPQRTWAVDRDAAIASIDAAVALDPSPRYVMVSYFGASLDHGVPEDNSFHTYAQAKAEADEHLRASELDFTLVMPSGLTLEDPRGRIEVRHGGEDLDGDQVSRANVAAVIAEVADREDLSGAEIAFNDGSTPIAEALDLLVEG